MRSCSASCRRRRGSLSRVCQRWPGASGAASVIVPVVTMSPATIGHCSGCAAIASTQSRSACSGPSRTIVGARPGRRRRGRRTRASTRSAASCGDVAGLGEARRSARAGRRRGARAARSRRPCRRRRSASRRSACGRSRSRARPTRCSRRARPALMPAARRAREAEHDLGLEPRLRRTARARRSPRRRRRARRVVSQTGPQIGA